MSALDVGYRAVVSRSTRRMLRFGWPLRIAAAVLLIVVLAALTAPWLAPQDPNSVNLGLAYAGPGGGQVLGTDSLGRDLLSRLMWGGRTSLLGPVLVIGISTVLGTAIAVFSAWLGGRVDSAIGALTDLLMAFPGVLLALVAVALFGSGLTAPVIALVVSYVPYMVRIIRAGAIRERSLPYIEALAVQQFSALRICIKHIIPNLAGTICAQASINFGYAMLDLAAISFIGLGVQPPTADWGNMVAVGQQDVVRGYPEQSLYAGILIVLTVVAVNIVGEAIADRAAEGRR